MAASAYNQLAMTGQATRRPSTTTTTTTPVEAGRHIDCIRVIRLESHNEGGWHGTQEDQHEDETDDGHPGGSPRLHGGAGDRERGARSARRWTHRTKRTTVADETDRGARRRARQRRALETHPAREVGRVARRARRLSGPDARHAEPRRHPTVGRRGGAIPATVPGTEDDGRPGRLTLDFPGYWGERLRHISWEEWFRTFDDRHLVFLFPEHLKSGRPSNPSTSTIRSARRRSRSPRAGRSTHVRHVPGSPGSSGSPGGAGIGVNDEVIRAWRTARLRAVLRLATRGSRSSGSDCRPSARTSPAIGAARASTPS